ncbi:HAD family hydrolase [Microbacterium hydrocarbonoxydans]|uniref:HAD family hydrolase n=1 Tax=Microbacterium hydrocarbonoxydans TaxID=273678 RepID=UPI00203F7CA1|nr:HAD family hydrolase [Microbacterium hydrocarbonoxydans]MCM3779813.1 HAD family hydrolase [Microbacterium hydrocarbonoxydans]
MSGEQSPGWAVLSDMDGTLLDTEATWLGAVERFVHDHLPSGRATADASGLVAASEGLDLVRTAALLRDRLDLPSDLDTVARELDRRALASYGAEIPWQPGARRLLTEFAAAGIPLALVTSSPRHWVEHFAQHVDLSLFRASITADDAPRTKPAPDPYLLGASALGMPPDRCLVLEDSLVGASAAVAAGCPTLVVGDLHRALPPGVHRTASLTEVDVSTVLAIVRAPVS